MRTNPRLTPEALWPSVSDATTFTELARRLYARGVLDLPFEERCLIAGALADRLGLRANYRTFRHALRASLYRS